AHVSPGTMSDVLDVTRAPVIFSHSAARAVVDVARTVPDSILRRVPANGGVVMVPFVTSFISPEVYAYDRAFSAAMREARRSGADTAAARKQWELSHPKPRATLVQVADQIEYVKKIVGPDHVGIGSDFDGITDVVVGLEDVSKFPELFAELARRGWSDADLRKLAGENLLRVFRSAEKVSAAMKKAPR